MAVKKQRQNKQANVPTAPPVASDGRIHSAVFHKRDSRVNDLVRQRRKSEIINLFNIDCCMLYRVEEAHIQFDAMQNNRPYIQFDGNAEGVFLPAKMGLLFPNACDQLDFRTDFPVPSILTYALSDLEIATLAGNGLFNNNWSCQGRLLGALLEIPCKIDYYAIAGTPITFIEIQDRLNLHTSTMKTGYKSLVSTFLPYSAQKHNAEIRPSLREYAKFDKDASQIRQRGTYDTQAVGFAADPASAVIRGGADFVAAAQARIQQRLKDQMSKGDVLGVNDSGKKVDNVSKTVEDIRARTDAARARAIKDAEEMGTLPQASVLDARLNDMAQRMVYAGAQAIPIQVDPINAKPLVDPKPAGKNDDLMTTPTTDISKSQKPDRIRDDKVEGVADIIAETDSKIHDAALMAQHTAADITKNISSRRDRLAARRAARNAARAQQSEAIESAAKAETERGFDRREADIKTQAPVKPGEPVKKKEDTVPPDSGVVDPDSFEGVDFDKLIKEAGL